MASRPAPWIVTFVAVSLGLWACSPLPKEGGAASAASTPKDTRRVAAVPSSSVHYDHFEGVAFSNSCDNDGDCHAAGCSGEVCSADADVSTVCTEYPDQPKSAACGCVKGLCIWYLTGKMAGAGATVAEPETPPPVRERPDASPMSTAPDQGQKCPAGTCAPGLECLTYFGASGPKGGIQSSCEIRCSGGHACPRGQTCTTVKDGPGQVCRTDTSK